MTDPTEGQTEGGLVYLEKLRGCIRMMFSTDIRYTESESGIRLLFSADIRYTETEKWYQIIVFYRPQI